MSITLTLDAAHTALVHVLAETHYGAMMGAADALRPGNANDSTSRLMVVMAEGYRSEAESARMLGQMIEALEPSLDPGDWSWPRRA